MSPSIFIITGPSGSGKSSILDLLVAHRPFRFRRFITCTTRPKRPGEQHGKAYWFLSRAEFEHGISKRHFFEWANVYGNYYGSSKNEMKRLLKGKRPIVMVLDVQGMRSIKKLYPETFVLFLDAPRSALIHRLEKRGTDPQDLRRRAQKIREEERAKRLADQVIMNRDGHLQDAYRRAVRLMRAHLRPA